MRKFTFDKTTVISYYLENDKLVVEGIDDLSPSDGYHTMHELYEHRMALNILLFKMMWMLDVQVRGLIETEQEPLIMKSKLHNDGTMFDGYFIVMAKTEAGQISYHYTLKHWDKFQIPVVDKIPFSFDGHGSKDVIERLLKL